MMAFGGGEGICIVIESNKMHSVATPSKFSSVFFVSTVMHERFVTNEQKIPTLTLLLVNVFACQTFSPHTTKRAHK